MTWHFWGSSHARTIATKLSKSSLASPLPFFCDTTPSRTTLWDAPSPPHCSGTCLPPCLALGCAFPLASLWDVPSPSPRSGTCLPPRLTLGRAFPLASLWDVPSSSPCSGTCLPPCLALGRTFALVRTLLFFLSFLFFADSLTVHRGPPLAHRRKGVGFFHDAAPFRSRRDAVPGAFFYVFPFLFRSLTAPLFLICIPPARPFGATCRIAPRHPCCVAPRRPCCVAPRVPRPQPSSATRRHHLPPLALGRAPFPHLVLGRDVTSPHVSFWDAPFHTRHHCPFFILFFFWFVLISFSFFADRFYEKREWGVPHAVPLPFWFVFHFFPADCPLSLKGALGPCLVRKCWGVSCFLESAHAAPCSRTQGATPQLAGLFFYLFFSHSLTDPPLTCIPPSRPCRVAPLTCRPVTSPPSHQHLMSPLAPSSRVASSSHIMLLCRLPRTSPCSVVSSLYVVSL